MVELLVVTSVTDTPQGHIVRQEVFVGYFTREGAKYVENNGSFYVMVVVPCKSILFLFRVAGTVGAIVTCPLEVVKTRLQSSTCGFHVQKVCLPKIAAPGGNNSHVTCKTILPHQRRRLTTYAARNSTQILAISHCGMAGAKTMGLLQCLR